MASLDSYLRDRDERVEKGTLVYGKPAITNRVNFDRLNADTFKHNNGTYHDKSRFYY